MGCEAVAPEIRVSYRQEARNRAQVFKLSKIENIATVLLRRETSFTDIILCIHEYAVAFGEKYGVYFVDDMMS